MKERPILFSGEMVRAILDGRKTMTRRVATKVDDVIQGKPLRYITHKFVDLENNCIVERSESQTGGKFFKEVNCPYGKVGDRLWVRESWCRVTDPMVAVCEAVGYAADKDFRSIPSGSFKEGDTVFNWDKPDIWKFSPSIHMPRWASRINLEITGVRVERLNEISVEDVIAEGLSSYLREHDACVDLKEQFEKLWDKINGKKHPWDSNPWVWVVEFRPVEIATK